MNRPGPAAPPGAPPLSRAARRGEAAYAALYGGLFCALGAHMAFLQLWLEDWGLRAEEIGWVNAVAVAARILTGLLAPALADRLGRPQAMMTALALAGAAAAGALALTEARWQIYALSVLFAIAYGALIPLSDAHGYASAERAGFSYRRARSVGSFAFLVATFACGATIARFGADATLVWIAAPLLLSAAAVLAAPMGAGAPAGEGAAVPDPLAAGGPGARPARWALRSSFLVFLLAVAAVQSSHAVYYVYGSVHWRGLGYSETLIGALWSWGVIAEIGAFFLGAELMRRLGAARALTLAGAAAVLRWGLMSLDPPLAAVWALQTLHGLTFGLTHLAALTFAQAAAPPGRAATAQGIVSASAGGAGMLIASLAAAAVYPSVAGGAYLIGAALAALGALAALRLRILAGIA